MHPVLDGVLVDVEQRKLRLLAGIGAYFLIRGCATYVVSAGPRLAHWVARSYGALKRHMLAPSSVWKAARSEKVVFVYNSVSLTDSQPTPWGLVQPGPPSVQATSLLAALVFVKLVALRTLLTN